jgi:hypothetical protein
MTSSAPIALFVYNRPEHTLKTLQAIKANRGSRISSLWIFSDGPRDAEDDDRRVSEVRRIVKSDNWAGTVTLIEQQQNQGLAKSIKAGITAILQQSDRVIVLEDDIVTSPGFLDYMNRSLELYRNDVNVYNISAYLPPQFGWYPFSDTFFFRMMCCWGWGTWRRAWRTADWDAGLLLGKIANSPGGIHRLNIDGTVPYAEHLIYNLTGQKQTWAIYWAASCYVQGGLSLFPHKSLVRNIGLDGSGENCGTSGEFQPLGDRIRVYRIAITESKLCVERFKAAYSSDSPSWLCRFPRHLLLPLREIIKTLKERVNSER